MTTPSLKSPWLMPVSAFKPLNGAGGTWPACVWSLEFQNDIMLEIVGGPGPLKCEWAAVKSMLDW